MGLPPRRARIASAHTLYTIIALLFGGVFALITPPLASPDELAHVFRAVTVSHGILIEDTPGEPLINRASIYGGLDDELYAMTVDRAVALTPGRIADVAVHRLDCEPVGRRALLGASAYPPLSYLWSAAAYRLTCALDGPTGMFVYGARIGNLLIATLLTALAIRKAPIGRWTLFTLALLPTTLFQSASFSIDSLSNAIVFLWVAYLARLFVDDAAIDARETAFGGALAVAMTLCKPGYPLLLLPALLVRRSRFRSRAGWLGFAAIAVVLPLIVTAIWAYSVRDIVVSRVRIDAAANLLRLRETPMEFLVALARALHDYAFTLFKQFFATLGMLDVTLPTFVYAMLAGLLLLSTTLNAGSRLPAWPVRVGLLSVALASVVVFAVPLYITYSDTAKNGLEGLQGRYFIPVAAMAMLAVAFDGTRWAKRLRPRVLYPASSALALALSVIAIGARYFDAIGSPNPKDIARYDGKMIRRLGALSEPFYVGDGKRWQADAGWMRKEGFVPGDVIPVPSVVFDAIVEAPTRLEVGAPRPKSRYEGKMIRRASSATGKEGGWYFVEDGRRRWVLDAGWMAAHGFSIGEVLPIDDSEFDAIPENPVPIASGGSR